MYTIFDTGTSFTLVPVSYWEAFAGQIAAEGELTEW